MNTSGPVLVPLDGSELAETALRIAVQVAHADRTRIVLLSVWEEPGSGTPIAVALEMEERARDYFGTYLREVRDRLAEPAIRTIVRCGDPCDVILDTAEEVGASMIAAASHGRSGPSRWLYGSTVNRLLHESHVPVLVSGLDAKRAIAGRVRDVRHVMVPLDGSALSEFAINSGAQLAANFGARLSLVRAVPWAYETYAYAAAAGYIQSFDNELQEGAEEYVRARESEITEKIDLGGFVLRGRPAEALIDFEKTHDVDLVVMTTHARSGLPRAALGSTADRMIQGKAPVLLLRPQADEASGSRKRDGDHALVALRD